MAKAATVQVRQKINKNYVSTVGRRREAVARVRLYTTKVEGVEAQKGDIIVNGKMVSEYFRFKAYAPVYNRFFLETDTAGKYIFTSRVTGGGLESQLDALILGMARALDKMDSDTFHSLLRDKGYLTRDPRTRERRKVGNAGKARRKKSSPKR